MTWEVREHPYFILLVLPICLVGLLGPAAALCTKDIECKGERICINGRCEDPRRSSEPPRAPVPRGAFGITLGMSSKEVGNFYVLNEKPDPMISISKELGMHLRDEKDLEAAHRALQLKFFELLPKKGSLGKGINSIDAEFITDSLHQIGIHYSRAYVDRLGWKALVQRYVPANFWLPTSKTSHGQEWTDSRTSLSIAYSGDLVNVHFSDLPSRQKIEDEEFKAKTQGGH